MKSILRVLNMNTLEDVNKIRRAIANNEGVVACEINKDKGEISIVYDSFFVEIDIIVESIEDQGYTVV